MRRQRISVTGCNVIYKGSQMNRAQRRAERHGRTKPVRYQSAVIPGLPAASEYSGVRDGYLTRTIARIMTTTGQTEWDGASMNELVFMFNTFHQLLVTHAEYYNEERGKDYARCKEILESIRARRQKTGKYGMTGDELTDMRGITFRLQDFFACVSVIRLAKAELAVHKEHEKHGPHRYEGQPNG
jgi:hypothetical protein